MHCQNYGTTMHLLDIRVVTTGKSTVSSREFIIANDKIE